MSQQKTQVPGFVVNENDVVVPTTVDITTSAASGVWLAAGFEDRNATNPSTGFYMAIGCADPLEAARKAHLTLKEEGEKLRIEQWAVYPLTDDGCANVSYGGRDAVIGSFRDEYVRIIL